VHKGVKAQRKGGAGVEGPRSNHFIPTSSRDAIAATESAWGIDAGGDLGGRSLPISRKELTGMDEL
jgi:hypothetical protein